MSSSLPLPNAPCHVTACTMRSKIAAEGSIGSTSFARRKAHVLAYALYSIASPFKPNSNGFASAKDLESPSRGRRGLSLLRLSPDCAAHSPKRFVHSQSCLARCKRARYR